MRVEIWGGSKLLYIIFSFEIMNIIQPLFPNWMKSENWEHFNTTAMQEVCCHLGLLVCVYLAAG